jgi:pyruvate/2-oxoglutarate dehydrogenase complex dihydrolipoamide acyltransferase (E2) component
MGTRPPVGLERPDTSMEGFMIYQLLVPGPIEDVEEIRVLEWHVGERTHSIGGQLLVELETHKAVVEVRTAQPAWMRRILCQPGEWQQIGKPLALLSDTLEEALPENLGTVVLPVEFEIT